MESKEKVQQLLKENKINADQATLLMKALDESAQRRGKILKQVLSQKQKRKNDIKGALGVGAVIVLCALAVFMMITNNRRFGRDTLQAMAFFEQSSQPLAQGNYLEALDLIKKGVKKAPHSPVGNTLLGSTYLILADQLDKPEFKQQAQVAFQKAEEAKDIQQRRQGMGSTALFFSVIFFLFVATALAVVFAFIYNLLVVGEEDVNESWARLRTFYDQKTGMIPALLEVVRGYAGHEKEALENVIQARSQAQAAINDTDIAELNKGAIGKVAQAFENLKSGLGRIFALSESYPELKASVNYLTVQQQIEVMEEKIVQARLDYNRQVKNYNLSLKIFPSSIPAALFAFAPKDYFEGV